MSIRRSLQLFTHAIPLVYGLSLSRPRLQISRKEEIQLPYSTWRCSLRLSKWWKHRKNFEIRNSGFPRNEVEYSSEDSLWLTWGNNFWDWWVLQKKLSKNIRLSKNINDSLHFRTIGKPKSWIRGWNFLACPEEKK